MRATIIADIRGECPIRTAECREKIVTAKIKFVCAYLLLLYRVSHFNLWTQISSKLRYLQKNGLDKS